ncbi:polysaccharide deacetylase family protein [Escherichia fergusonii]|uniref:Carbohydrate transport protein shf protein encoded by Plasmid pAA2, Plasmid virulence plasmid pWR501 and Plasmid pCP301 n=1 Tax=Escherichia fergusonii (strain ATCC 35469 / DSM 13698 / CCUG 18766 / IAM 14443 / JCM 21226 / LMG 7866 / NBRC 102419 / NCTC 12128 / CDC 0568-73) TaxID=585054 RepID=B7LTC3_ESCF3|nr:polysaccharide deacetylase family protein [Escherichia fergusonii]EIH2135121.1 polysaccharide deacetylase family protein [Escherichia fergusonii]EIH2154666.1 polysaccharide deacetylase family protein [Escherichia fergusonii]EIH9410081.1 polysaccharide deacetylase family protein [Escherichia fergusonii]EIH9431572.1 polysaccharide deacetylase family protein [Escherichia fergusonii]QQC69357.1 polysaccharide deacetylase family protein [Escherichia fergusonii]
MLKAKNLPVLMYHHVSNCPGLVTLSPKTFREQMKWLADHKWKTVTSDEIEYFYEGGELPRKSVMLTFDDGYLDNWFQVYPVLKEFNLKAHIFLIAGLIGDGPIRSFQKREYSHQDCEQIINKDNADDVMLRWSEVDVMLSSGLVEFHIHTHSHIRWDKMYSYREEQCQYLKQDILESRKVFLDKIGKCSKHFCWPEGYYNSDYIKVAEELGFSYLYTTERRMNNRTNGTLRLGRISTKEREHSAWLKRRLFCYTTPLFSSLLALYKGPRVTD